MKPSMNSTVFTLLLAGGCLAPVLPAAAQSGAPYTVPPMPALSAQQAANLDQELLMYRRGVDDRVARGELRSEEAQRLVEWRRWQLARQIAGLAPAEPARVIVERRYVAEPYAAGYGPYPYYAQPYYYPPRYYVPRLSVCAGGWGRHSFGSLCF